MSFDFRSTCTGLCSGAARFGALAGVIVGELEIFHSSIAINIVAGIVTLISGAFIQFLPDMTRQKMPVTFEDIAKVQFPENRYNKEQA